MYIEHSLSTNSTVRKWLLVSLIYRASLLICVLHGAQCVPAGRFKLALVQMAVGADKAANVRRACRMVKEAVQNGAGMVVLPVRKDQGIARTVMMRHT